MADVLLINAPVRGARDDVHASLGLPLGLAYIAAVLRQHGYRPSIVDLNISGMDPARIRSIIEMADPALVGISTHTETYMSGLEFARMAKEIKPGLPVVRACQTFVSTPPSSRDVRIPSPLAGYSTRPGDRMARRDRIGHCCREEPCRTRAVVHRTRIDSQRAPSPEWPPVATLSPPFRLPCRPRALAGPPIPRSRGQRKKNRDGRGSVMDDLSHGSYSCLESPMHHSLRVAQRADISA